MVLLFKKLAIILVILLVIGVLGYGFRFGLDFLPAKEVVMDTYEYESEHVLIRVYADEDEVDKRWILLGTNDGDVRIAVIAPPARGIYKTPGFSSVQYGQSFIVRIDRKKFGLWIPDDKIRFEIPRDKLTMLSKENKETMQDEFIQKLQYEKYK